MNTADALWEITNMADILKLPDPILDERLRLLFICCHPALGAEVRAALALKVICGLPTGRIAQLFVVSEAAMFQRITRAKAKVREAGIAFELPPRREWPERLGAALLAFELAFTASYADAGDELSAALEDDLGAEVERLAMLVAELLPQAPEALGLAALTRRRAARWRGRGGAALAAGHRAVGLCPDRARGLGAVRALSGDGGDPAHPRAACL